MAVSDCASDGSTAAEGSDLFSDTETADGTVVSGVAVTASGVAETSGAEFFFWQEVSVVIINRMIHQHMMILAYCFISSVWPP